MIESIHDIDGLLANKVNLPEIREINQWITDHEQRAYLLQLAKHSDGKDGINALWCITHMKDTDRDWLQSLQDELIDMLLTERNTAKKRMVLQLLREQTYSPDTIRTDFLDYCLSKINSECEPYAIRCFSIYCAYKMCRFFPELMDELNEHLDMLATQSLSTGLASALRITRKQMKGHKRD